MKEEQVYRIDHFLGKEATQNLHVLRFANRMIGNIWCGEHVEQVQIDVPETLDVADRAAFYDATGALRDMVVTHLFQVAAEIAMEPPIDFSAENLQEAREAVLSAFRPLAAEDVVLGQADGYLDLPEVADGSTTDTYAAVRLWVDTDRWHGVPFLLRSGKYLAESAQRVSIVLKDAGRPADRRPRRRFGAELLALRLRSGGDVDVVVKKPGAGHGAGQPDGRPVAGRRGRRRPVAAVCLADPRRDDRGPLAVHQQHRSFARLECGRGDPGEPAGAAPVRAGFGRSGGRFAAGRSRRLAGRPGPPRRATTSPDAASQGRPASAARQVQDPPARSTSTAVNSSSPRYASKVPTEFSMPKQPCTAVRTTSALQSGMHRRQQGSPLADQRAAAARPALTAARRAGGAPRGRTLPSAGAGRRPRRRTPAIDRPQRPSAAVRPGRPTAGARAEPSPRR